MREQEELSPKDSLLRMAAKQSSAQRRSRWQVRESTARGLCRLTFIVLGLLPLLTCLSCCLWQFLPSYQQVQVGYWQDALSSQLGLKVTVAAFEAQAPARFALHEIRLIHPETGISLGRVRLAEVQRVAGKWAVRLRHAQLEGQQLATTGKIVHDWFLCRPQNNNQLVQINVNELAIQGAASAKHLADISLRIIPSEDAMVVGVEFELADQTGEPNATLHTLSEPAQLMIMRHHARDRSRTEVQLRTGTAPLPCSLAVGLHPGIELLGGDVDFAGTINLDLRANEWRVHILDSRLTALDFGQLTRGTEVALSGVGAVALNQLVITQQGLESAQIHADIRSGRIAHVLLNSLGKHLGVGLRPTNPGLSHGFERLQFAIEISQPRLHLAGLIEDAYGPLASRNNWQEALPLEKVVAALADCSPAAAANAEITHSSPTWLAKRAMVWLPLSDQPMQTAHRDIGLSRTE